MNPTVVLVHGAWHGSWCWGELIPALEAHGLPVATVDLPSSGPDVTALGDLDADVAALTAVLDAVGGPKILLGHSYGGLPVTQAAAGRQDVVHLVYVCAFMLDAGVSLIEAAGGEPPSWWRPSEDGTWMTADRPEEVFYSDCDPAVAAAAVPQLQPQSLSSCRQPLSAAAWETIPSTYVVADRDPELPQFVQEGMATGRATRVVHIDAGHSPFLSRPGELAAIVAACAEVTAAPAQAD
ncbi:alpha/beta hydrolase [Micromonospora sp. NPDC049679]|uniref:alpha/beta hydrolase n=1 Tax=Micromonospora sp. NPDC049679 TaxID=3155920 RepID=UPI0033C8737A